MNLNIRYARTKDGVSIAYASAGQGRPLVRIASAPFSHFQLEWQQSDFYDQLCRNRLLIVFDPRGTGMSDRDVQDYSLDSRLLDIQAVVDSLGLDSFALHAIWHGGPERQGPARCASGWATEQSRTTALLTRAA